MENRNNRGLTQGNITYTSDNHTLFTVESISLLQSEISSKMVKYINREYSSKKNDLGLCLDGESNYLKLAEYIKILEEVKYCNTCFQDFHPSEIIFAVKNNINKLN